ncbi:hypothetical protein ACFYPK_28425 [Streptomyces halstedii]|uniref:hypothetical protein n=1 Tax=Streptomyces halstedii TaxID=1944 RepID=UPI00345F4511
MPSPPEDSTAPGAVHTDPEGAAVTHTVRTPSRTALPRHREDFTGAYAAITLTTTT